MMKISEIAEKLHLEWVHNADSEISSAYACDLLSIVMNKAKPGAVWMTVQSHKNIIAVAKMADISAVIVCNGFSIEQDTAETAVKENVALLKTEKNMYEISGMLWENGIR